MEVRVCSASGPGRFDKNARAAVQPRAQHLEDALRGILLITVQDLHVALEALHAADELRGRPGVKPELIEDLHFSPHLSGT
jgi:hypothetical protein